MNNISPLSKESQAYLDGYKAGQADRRLGRRSAYSSFVESRPSYTRNYAIGYNDGLADSWMGKKRIENLGGAQ